MTNGMCQACPPGWTASGAYCAECAKGVSCDPSGVPRCEGQCAAGFSPTCDAVTARSVCSPCSVNQTFLDAEHRRLTRGGVLDASGLCAAYFQCNRGYYLTSNADQTGVTCAACVWPEPSQLGWFAMSRGLTFGDKFSCMYAITPTAANASNGLGQYGANGGALSSCNMGFTSEPHRAASIAECSRCPNTPGFNGIFDSTRFDCTVQCDAKFSVQRGEECILNNRAKFECDEDGYSIAEGGVCTSSPVPWSEPGSVNTGGGLNVSGTERHAGNEWLTGLDPVSRYWTTETTLNHESGLDMCQSVINSASAVGYVQDIPLFTPICSGREMHTHYMVVHGDKFLYLMLERTFGNNNRYVMWQVQVRVDNNVGFKGKVWQTWRLPGKVCSAAWTSLKQGADHLYLAFCGSPFLVYVLASDFSDSLDDSDATSRDVRNNNTQFAIGRRYGILIGQDTTGKSDGMRDVARFGSSLSLVNTSNPRRLLLADMDNCRILEVVIDSPGSFMTRATTIGAASCFSGPVPTPQPEMITSGLGGRVVLFVTSHGVVQMDYKFREFQLVIPAAAFPLAPRWLLVDNGGSTVVFVNETHRASVQRIQSACPRMHKSKRGAMCTRCANNMYVSAVGTCVQCSIPVCSDKQRLLACGDTSDARCQNCTGTSEHPYRYGSDCSVLLVAPCPTGYFALLNGDCQVCPSVWSPMAYIDLPEAGKCSCFHESAGATVSTDGVCVVESPFSQEAGPVETPQWAWGFNCSYEYDEACKTRGCYLKRVFPRECVECPDGLFGITGMYCERCYGFRVPSPAKDSCICMSPSHVAERDGSGMCVCPVGHEVRSGALGCSPCSAGWFKNTSTLMLDDYWDQTGGECERCPPGTDSSAGASSCTPCTAGKYKDASMDVCGECNAGVGKFYPRDAKDGGSCAECKDECQINERWSPCPRANATDVYACNPCVGTTSSTRIPVPGADNRDCLWECRPTFYMQNFACWQCSRLTCPVGFVLSECTRYADANCDTPCSNATKPIENAEWGPKCSWNCAAGYSAIVKEYLGWTEFACEARQIVPWSWWW